ncbi:hypothetical protein LCM4573_00980 [Rhizobium sp. LCM 4573]|nr:hypothetical protein LCM4573_00980 [Rhizobium sp. LCM 4573]
MQALQVSGGTSPERHSLTLKAVILNDTRGDNHFGCLRVMRIIEENLARRNIQIVARSLVRNDWENDRRFLAVMSDSNIIVINGEGTLHHGAAQGERLLRVVDHPARGDKPVVLINTLYQENPTAWGRYLERIALISTRDSWSAEAASAQAGRPVGFVPDLSLAEGAVSAPTTTNRNLLLVGDSVSREVSRTLAHIAFSRADARFLPILKTLKPSKPHYPPPLRMLREAYIHLHAAASGMRHPNILFSKDEAGFIEALQHAYLHVTGRFHAVCFCLFTGTPFLAVDSNSWKIGALLNDFGLGTERLTTPSSLSARLSHPEGESYSDEERRKIGIGLEKCRTDARLLFDEIERIGNLYRRQ